MDLAIDVHLQRAQVGSGTLRQHELRALEQRRTLVLGAALAPPRLWSYLLEAALDGFGDGFQRPHDGRMSTRMHQGLRVNENIQTVGRQSEKVMRLNEFQPFVHKRGRID